MIVQLSTLGSKHTSNRLNVDVIMNDVEWISYKPEIETKALPTENNI